MGRGLFRRKEPAPPTSRREPKAPLDRPRPAVASQRVCPNCTEAVDSAARACPACGLDLTGNSLRSAAPAPSTPPTVDDDKAFELVEEMEVLPEPEPQAPTVEAVPVAATEHADPSPPLEELDVLTPPEVADPIPEQPAPPLEVHEGDWEVEAMESHPPSVGGLDLDIEDFGGEGGQHSSAAASPPRASAAPTPSPVAAPSVPTAIADADPHAQERAELVAHRHRLLAAHEEVESDRHALERLSAQLRRRDGELGAAAEQIERQRITQAEHGKHLQQLEADLAAREVTLSARERASADRAAALETAQDRLGAQLARVSATEEALLRLERTIHEREVALAAAESAAQERPTPTAVQPSAPAPTTVVPAPANTPPPATPPPTVSASQTLPVGAYPKDDDGPTVVGRRVEAVTPLKELACPGCKTAIPIYISERPLRLICPSCGKRGRLTR